MGASYSHADAAPVHAEDVLANAKTATEAPAAPRKPSGPFAAGLASATAAQPSVNAGVSSSKPSTTTASSKPWWRSFERSDLPNPGSYEEINQEGGMILRPNLIEGLSFNFTAPVTEAVALGSVVEMGAKDRPGQFAMAANYFTNRLVMISRITPSDARINGRIFINHTPALTSKIIADIGPQPDSSKGTWDLDYRGSDFCGQLKVASGGVVAVSYLQSVTPWLALGGEGFYQGKSQFSALTGAVKYSHGPDTASLSVATFGPVIANFMHRVNPRVAFATELFMDGRTRDSHVSFGYRFDLKSATVVGHIDSAGRVAATLEERINPALSLTLSGELDHAKEDYKFGFGVNIGGG